MKLQNFIVILFASILLVGCGKDKEAPMITFSSPDAAATYMNGDTIHIHGDVMDNEMLADYELEVLNSSEGDAVLFSKSFTSTDEHAHFHEEYVVDVAMHTNLTFHVHAHDAAGNSAEEQVVIHIMQ